MPMKNKIVMILVVVILGALAYYFWQNFMSRNTSSSSPSSTTSKSSKSTTQPQSNLPAGWTWCVDKEDGFTFAHPNDWKFNWATSEDKWSAQAQAYDNGTCSSPGGLSPQAQLDYLTKKYGVAAQSLLTYRILPPNTTYNTIDKLYSYYQSSNASESEEAPAPSNMININGLKGFYMNQKTNSYSDNYYVIQLAPSTFIEFTNRESDKHYTPSPNSTVDDQNDYTQYTPTVDAIVKTIHTTQ